MDAERLGAAALTGLLMSALLAAGGPAAMARAAPAAPTQTVVAWSTYLRTGPGETYAAIEELEHDTRVAVLGCDARWCRISRAVGPGVAGPNPGYVDRDALDLPRTLAPQPPAKTDCVVVGQADNRGPIPTRFCSASPGSR